MTSSKKLTSKGTSRHLFIRVYRLEVHSVLLVFSTQFLNLLPLQPSLWFNSPPSPRPCVNKYTVWGGGRYGVLGLRQINTCRKVPLQIKFFRWRHFCFGVYIQLVSQWFRLNLINKHSEKMKPKQSCWISEHLAIWTLNRNLLTNFIDQLFFCNLHQSV